MPTLSDDLDALTSLLDAGDVAVLSGAGLSTESGIPDYRGPTGRTRGTSPMMFQEFLGSLAAQRRYWARSHVGWRQIGTAAPNDGHLAVAALQRSGVIAGIITQNVDGLHQAAGARDVIDLHGRLDRVVCLDCCATSPRGVLDVRLRRANAAWEAEATALNPDGDAVISDADVARFTVVGCGTCGGRLKPDVVFFGENVPKPRVEASYAVVAAARSLVVLGSSLTVASGYRFVRHAWKLGRPIAIVNQGPTRGDELADTRLDAPLGRTLNAVVNRIRQVSAPETAAHAPG